MGHDQEGGNEERESGRVGLGEKDVLSNVVRTTELLAAAAVSAAGNLSELRGGRNCADHNLPRCHFGRNEP